MNEVVISYQCMYFLVQCIVIINITIIIIISLMA
jgi:hypothetical protein